MIRPTSKASLKSQCLLLSKGRVEEAEKLYDFYIKDMDGLPMFDIVPPSTVQNVKETALNIFGWVKENKDDIIQGIDFIRSLKNGSPISSVNTDTPPLPPININ